MKGLLIEFISEIKSETGNTVIILFYWITDGILLN